MGSGWPAPLQSQRTAINFDAWLTATTVTNIHYFCQRNLGRSAALDGVRTCLDQFRIVSVTASLLQAAISLAGKDFEDDLQIVAAQAVEAQAIVTRNARDYQHSPIEVLAPTECVRRLPA